MWGGPPGPQPTSWSDCASNHPPSNRRTSNRANTASPLPNQMRPMPRCRQSKPNVLAIHPSRARNRKNESDRRNNKPKPARGHCKVHRHSRLAIDHAVRPVSNNPNPRQRPNLERLGRPSQHPFPIRQSRGPQPPNYTQAKTQMGFRISKRYHRVRNAHHLRRQRFHRSRRRNRVFSRRTNRLRPLDLHRRLGSPSLPGARKWASVFRRFTRECIRTRIRHRRSALENKG
jgi:hypothetical protein